MGTSVFRKSSIVSPAAAPIFIISAWMSSHHRSSHHGSSHHAHHARRSYHAHHAGRPAHHVRPAPARDVLHCEPGRIHGVRVGGRRLPHPITVLSRHLHTIKQTMRNFSSANCFLAGAVLIIINLLTLHFSFSMCRMPALWLRISSSVAVWKLQTSQYSGPSLIYSLSLLAGVIPNPAASRCCLNHNIK